MSEKAIQRMGFTDMVEGFKAMGMGFENMFPLGKQTRHCRLSKFPDRVSNRR